MSGPDRQASIRSFFLPTMAGLVATLVLARPTLAVSPAEADQAFAALNKLYWDDSGHFFRRQEQGNTRADFWFAAQLWDTVMDQFERTGDGRARRQIHDLYDGFVKAHPDWTRNKYNDDIMWWVISCTRAHALTGDARYLKKARENFDFVYDRFADDAFGGGIYWTSDKTSKNSCINSPAAIAATKLSSLLKDDGYLLKARSLYAWQKKTLTDGNGKVFDNIRLDRARQSSRIGRGSLTYNQGTFIGAGVLLYLRTRDRAYLDDAVKAAQWTRANLCITERRILRDEGQGDGGAFKGIFIRYMAMLIREGGQDEFTPWMKANADSAWRNRRPADNIMGADWTVVPARKVESQTAASAVAAVIQFADRAPSAPPAGKAP